MKKKIFLFSALVGAFFLASCSGGSKNTPIYSAEDVTNANEVLKYYDTSIGLLKHMVIEKDVNAVVGYMEARGNVPIAPIIQPPMISGEDSAAVMKPGACFDEETQANLIHNYDGLFASRVEFYKLYDQYVNYLKDKKIKEADQLADGAYRLSIEMSEYKQNIFDILSPATEQAEKVILDGDPLKHQILAVRKMSAEMRSIVNLYARKHVVDHVRLDIKMEELKKELEAAKSLPAVSDHEKEMKSFQEFLTSVDSFIKDVQKAREKGDYNESDYDALIVQYGVALN